MQQAAETTVRAETPNPQIDLAEQFVRYTGQSVFLTGKAGTGKTTFLRNLRHTLSKRMAIVAPTGVAAINAGGVTIHSFFQLPFGPNIPAVSDAKGQPKRTSEISKISREKRNIIRTLDLLVIDEISMVRADLLDAIDEVLRRFRDHHQPFGGVQLLMIGDLQQLSPVVKDEEWDLLRSHYESVYFFSSHALKKLAPVYIELTHIYRQSDVKFIGLLNRVRENLMDDETIQQLNQRYIPNFVPNESEGYITLTTHNATARQINETKLSQINDREYCYKARVQGDFPVFAYPADQELRLKQGAQVMFLKNDSSPEKRFFNGKIGKVVEMDDDTITILCPQDEFPIYVEKAKWENTKYVLDEQTGELNESVTGDFVQFPLRLAWAITIHKSQGLTFERAIIDAHAAFAHGQVYVALSRCKTLEGLVLSSPLVSRSVRSDNTVKRFIQEAAEKPANLEILESAKHNFQLGLLEELFDFSSLRGRSAHLAYETRRHDTRLHQSFIGQMEKVHQFVINELVPVSEKFKAQIRLLDDHRIPPAENKAIIERVLKAVPWFKEKLSTGVENVLQKIALETDNKETRKAVSEALTQIKSVIDTKTSCLRACENGFEVEIYLAARAKGSIEIQEPKKSGLSAMKKAPADVLYPKLYWMLKEWREEMAAKLETDERLIISYKSMIEVANLLPVHSRELKKIKGIGKKKIAQFGREIVSVVDKFIRDESLKPLQTKEFPENNTTGKELKTPSHEITLQLYLANHSIESTAKERNMAVTTIESHLAKAISNGKLDIQGLVSDDKIKAISHYFDNAESPALSPAKEALGENFSYGEIKLTLAYLLRD